MKKIGNISRSIITIIFICFAVIIIAGSIIHGESSIFTGNKILYYLIAILSMLGIVYINHMQNLKKHLKGMPKLKTVYKYVYIFVLTIFSRIIMAYMHYKSGNIIAVEASSQNGMLSLIVNGLESLFTSMSIPSICAYCTLNIIVTFLTAVVIKKIIFRVCENETIAYIASVLYIYIPANLYWAGMYNRYLLNMLFIMLGIYYIIKIYYEIVQYKVKSNKYLIYTIILTLTAIMDILFGGNIWFWIVLVVVFMLTSLDVDTVKIRYKASSTPKRDYVSKNIKNEEAKSKSKTLNNAFVSSGVIHIPKSLIVLVILTAFGTMFQIIYNLSQYGAKTAEFYNIAEVLKHIVIYTKPYYIWFGCIIIICQILCIILKRKLDYKTFILMVAAICYPIFSTGWQEICGIDIVFATLFEVLLVILIGNIYYNRDEKIKLLTR